MAKKEDKLEKFVAQNRQDFDHATPPDVWQSIEKSLPKEDNKNHFWTGFLKRAASIVIIATLSIVIYEALQNEQKPTDEIVAETVKDTVQEPEQITEMEVYYTSQINDRLLEIQSNELYPEVKEELREELMTLDSAYSDLKSELNEAVVTEDLIEAMMDNYKMKLEILEEILEELKRVNGDENEDINI